MPDKTDIASIARKTYDHLILGGGSAGCTLAARLSEDPNVSVLLVEAGKDLTRETASQDVLSNYPAKAYFNPDYTWRNLKARLGGALLNRPDAGRIARYEQSKLLGGGSSINGLCANRGAPGDYDDWGDNGASGWSWDAVLPYFRKLERDLNYGGEFHGSSGPIAISRFPREDWSGFAKGITQELENRGLAYLPDQNAEWMDGFMPTAVSVDERMQRVSCAYAYLDASVRARANLTILTETQAERIIFDGVRATGAVIANQAGRHEVKGREVIVCSGTIYSPTLLMRSGIGPAEQLQRNGIDVVAARTGVGRNLHEHPTISVSCYLNRAGRMRQQERHHTQAHVRFSSGLEGCPETDMMLAVISRSGWHAMGARVGTLYVWVNKSYSKGMVTLASPSPSVEPEIDFRMLSDERDLKRLRAAFRFVSGLVRSPDMESVRSVAFPANYSDRVRRVSSPGLRNQMLMQTFAGVLDMLPALRPWLIRRFVTEGASLDALLNDDVVLDAYLNKAVTGTWHPVGTCRMGRRNDPLAVTDERGRVYGVQGLRVVDASIMPSVPCANTNIPTIMVAERIADMIKQDRETSTAASAPVGQTAPEI
jgi:5-(hydroxymethyl)furfural/furfural oxidase